MSKKKHDVPEELLASLLANYQKPEDLIGEEGLLKHLTKLVVERALEAEMTDHPVMARTSPSLTKPVITAVKCEVNLSHFAGVYATEF